MTKAPSKDFQFFLDNVKELEKQYKGQYIAIKDCKVLGAYVDFATAAKTTVAQGHKPGTFIVQRADSDPASYTVTIVTPNIFRVV